MKACFRYVDTPVEVTRVVISTGSAEFVITTDVDDPDKLLIRKDVPGLLPSPIDVVPVYDHVVSLK